MLAYIEGRLLETTTNSAILLSAGGVGYEVFMTSASLSQLPNKGETVCVYLYTVVREDALELYGFFSWDERQTFILLTSISKVGAKTALSILATFRPDDLRKIVLEDNIEALTRVSGIGKKTAQHVFLELKYKLKTDDISSGSMILSGSSPSVLREAVTGLLNLGYAEEEAEKTVREVLSSTPELDVSGALRAALKKLASLSGRR
ncbi:Holliday junction branch migration protein RuvA [Desulfovibrio litoralis]|uniref:Holliday junction branch migration complex subunit RuvA n=1 Tax=Desulfovibrio litoralis DSM 11393 TaxID=1121455 RepID=A0A1M7SQ47_9BACT|nr:Holliday junction branch migration protein RuvA [Desulfovibrio litoralis]SHN60667.1 Holliday junction DNA helicase subunit RuvA [Desulfovibrio litoralis DSM 11393]